MGDNCFMDASNLVISDLILPNLTSIGANAFARTKIEQVSDLGSITSISLNCFAGCKALTSVTLPNTVTSIGNTAFQNCITLTTINIPSGVTSIGRGAFQGCTGLTSINIPSGITSIDHNAFRESTNLVISNLSLPNLTSLGEFAFRMTKVEQVSDLGRITTIPQQAFYKCETLTSVVIPNTVTSLGNSVFAFSTALTTITIPSSITSIGTSAFNTCSSLSSVTILATTPPTSGGYMFDNNAAGRKIYVPAESVNAYKTASGWSTYAADIEAIP